MNKPPALMVPAIAFILLAGYLGVIFFMLDRGVPQPESQALGQLIGTLNTLVGSAVGYYIGTTHSSQAKDGTIANALEGKDHSKTATESNDGRNA